MKRGVFIEGGNIALIVVVIVYTAFRLLAGGLGEALWRFLPLACILSVISYVLFCIELEG